MTYTQSFIETQFPVSKVSKESYKERMANYSQTLTGLGKWWGRKPLILVRATLLGLLMPASENPDRDREIFLKILTMDENGLWKRYKESNKRIAAKDIYTFLIELDEEHEKRVQKKAQKYKQLIPGLDIQLFSSPKAFLSIYFTEKNNKITWKKDIDAKDREFLERFYFESLFYDEKIRDYCNRPEQIDGPAEEDWKEINSHLGTNAKTLVELFQELGIQRFGHIPKVGDAFCGGGSIPFEAARMGCEVYASDLNPVAALLTWAALNIVGGGEEVAKEVRKAQEEIYQKVDKQVTEWGIEHNEFFHRADAYLYCVEVEDPETGWKVPLAPSWVIGEKTKTVAILEPDEANKRYAIKIKMNASDEEMKKAKEGTVQSNYVIHPKNPNPIPMTLIRRENIEGLRLWEKTDIIPRKSDVFQERLYCIRYVKPPLVEIIKNFIQYLKNTDHPETKEITLWIVGAQEAKEYSKITGGAVYLDYRFTLNRNFVEKMTKSVGGIFIKHPEVLLSIIKEPEKASADKKTLGKSGISFKKSIGDWDVTVGIYQEEKKLVLEEIEFHPRNKNKDQMGLFSSESIEKQLELGLVDWNFDAEAETRYYTAPTQEDLLREEKALQLLQERFSDWQDKGYVPSKKIESGYNTDQPIRERGWQYWHQMFNPRQLLNYGLLLVSQLNYSDLHITVGNLLGIGRCIDYSAKLCKWASQPGFELSTNVFNNLSLNTFYNYPTRSLNSMEESFYLRFKNYEITKSKNKITTQSIIDATDFNNDIWITDPPYADAVNYHELTEFFLAWYEHHILKLFPDWYSDSKRALAIKGDGAEFRKSMVEAYSNLAKNMPENGMQVVMFTHQDAGVWADLALILWASGLKVTTAWTIATETTSELKKGNYVQGTVLLILRKNTSQESVFIDELIPLIEDEVKSQIDSMIKIEDKEEPNFSDTDYQLAAYAASLRILTKYKNINDIDITKELMRPSDNNEKNQLTKIIEDMKDVANSYLIPVGMDKAVWKDLIAEERFYLKGLDLESKNENRSGSYQELAKGYGIRDYSELFASAKANEVRLKTPQEFGSRLFGKGEGFESSVVRHILYALDSSLENDQARSGVNWLQNEIIKTSGDRNKLVILLRYLARFGHSLKHWKKEAEMATQIAGILENER